MADAVWWQLLESAKNRIEALVFSTQTGDTAPAPVDAAIVIRKLPFSADDDKHDRSEATPGIIVAPTRAVTPRTAGTNRRDDTTYGIAVQIIDHDPTYRGENLHTYLKWAEQIRKLFQNQTDSNVQGDEGCVGIGYVPSEDPVNARIFESGKYFVVSLELAFIVREPRGATT